MKIQNSNTKTNGELLRNQICFALGIRVDQLKSDSQHPKITAARLVIIKILRDKELLSFAKIGSLIYPKCDNHSWAAIRYKQFHKNDKAVEMMKFLPKSITGEDKEVLTPAQTEVLMWNKS